MPDKSSSRTLVIQSQSQPLPFAWLKDCMDSVVSWCAKLDYEYQFYGDELFNFVDPLLVDKFASQKVIITDLARLIAAKESLNQDYDRVLWLDSDFLIFAPEEFQLPEMWKLDSGYMVGREVWVQSVSNNKDKLKSSALKAYVKVHNAFLLFDRGNSFLDFYIDQAERFLHSCTGSVSPQFIGPKLLTALHNVIQCPVMEEAGMFSPVVIRDLLSDGENRPALDLMRQRSISPVCGANLCSSLVNEESDEEQVSSRDMELLVQKLITHGTPV